MWNEHVIEQLEDELDGNNGTIEASILAHIYDGSIDSACQRFLINALSEVNDEH